MWRWEMARQWEEVEFAVVAEKDLWFYIRCWQETLPAPIYGKPGRPTIEGLKDCRTSHGDLCVPIDDDTFKIVVRHARIDDRTGQLIEPREYIARRVPEEEQG